LYVACSCPIPFDASSFAASDRVERSSRGRGVVGGGEGLGKVDSRLDKLRPSN